MDFPQKPLLSVNIKYMYAVNIHSVWCLMRAISDSRSAHPTMHHCVYAHCTCRWGVQSNCQKLCPAGLLGVQRTVQNYSWKSKMNWKHELTSLVSALEFTKYVRCEGPATLSFPSSIAKKHCSPLSPTHPPLTSSCNACISDAWVPEHELKLTFQAWPTHTYVHTYISEPHTNALGN